MLQVFLCRLHFIIAGICILYLTGCNKSQNNASSDEVVKMAKQATSDNVNKLSCVVSDSNSSEFLKSSKTTSNPEYEALCDSIRSTFGELPTLNSICSLSVETIRAQNNFRYNNQEDQSIETAQKNLSIAKKIQNVYDRIFAYKRMLSFGMQCTGQTSPFLTDITTDNDSLSSVNLPNTEVSDYLKDGSFFFLGGGPFINRKTSEETYTDADGNREIRLSCSVNKNTSKILDAICHLGATFNIEFGPPLLSYDSGPQEIKGIGSLIHTITGRIPVFLLTENGAVPAQLVSINYKLVPEELGCVSDLPEVVFACSTIPKKEILGIYIPYSFNTVISCTIIRKNKFWTADLNNDGIAELGAVTKTFEGITGNTMYRIFWYGNLKGKWVLIDAAEELDCT